MTADIRARAGQARIELRETDKAFADLRLALIDKLLGTPAEAVSTRERCYMAVNAADAVQTALRRILEGAMIEEAVEEMTRPPPKPDSPFTAPIRGAGFH